MSSQSRPVGLIIAGLALTAAALLVWMIVRAGDDSASASPPQQPAAGAPVDPPAPRAERPNGPGSPQVAESAQERRSGNADRPVTETIVNGVRVRDHRRDRSTPILVQDRPPGVGVHRVSRTVTADLNNRILPFVRECVSGVPPEARGARPRVESQVIISIKDHQARVTEATVEISDAAGATLESAKQCIQQKALGVTVPAADEDDVENYPIRLSYSLQ
jgi:hypothetical protein